MSVKIAVPEEELLSTQELIARTDAHWKREMKRAVAKRTYEIEMFLLHKLNNIEKIVLRNTVNDATGRRISTDAINEIRELFKQLKEK